MDWIKEGEKFALIGLAISVDPGAFHLDLPAGLSVLSKAAFSLPDDWREWIGTIRVQEVKAASLYLVARMPTKQPTILDEENKILQQRINCWFTGLTLTAKFTAFEKPFIVQGSRVKGELDLRSFGSLDRPHGGIVSDLLPIGADHLKEAAQLGARLRPVMT